MMYVLWYGTTQLITVNLAFMPFDELPPDFYLALTRLMWKEIRRFKLMLAFVCPSSTDGSKVDTPPQKSSQNARTIQTNITILLPQVMAAFA
jgi:hypothetical protein